MFLHYPRAINIIVSPSYWKLKCTPNHDESVDYPQEPAKAAIFEVVIKTPSQI